jgi:hypothetical protein
MRFLPSPLLLAFAAALSCGTGCYGWPACRVNLDCPSGQVCMEGSCQHAGLIACAIDSDCPGGHVCLASVCQADCSVQGCPQNELCDGQSHRCRALVYASTNGGGSGTSGTTSSGTTTGGTTTAGSTGSGTTTGGTTGPPPVPYCHACIGGTDCGSTTDLCIKDARGFSFCGTDCGSGQQCPTGATCTDITDPNSGNFLGKNCFPNTYLCWCAPNGDTWSNYADAFLQNNCQYCHVNHSGNTQFTSYANVQGVAQRIESQIGNGLMPLGKTLSQGDQARILNWFECGLPQ